MGRPGPGYGLPVAVIKKVDRRGKDRYVQIDIYHIDI